MNDRQSKKQSLRFPPSTIIILYFLDTFIRVVACDRKVITTLSNKSIVIFRLGILFLYPVVAMVGFIVLKVANPKFVSLLRVIDKRYGLTVTKYIELRVTIALYCKSS